MGAATAAIDDEFPRWRLGVVLGAALAFYIATMFDVATGREDWPISPYPMYSDMPGTTASRWTFTGVSDNGEFKLTDEHTAPFHGARLLSINKSLEHRSGKRAQFIRKLAHNYDERRESAGWPQLQAIRFYRETWNLREYVKGIDRPDRELVSSMYLAPSTLLERLNAEADGRAAPEAPLRAAGDTIVDLQPAACVAGCSAEKDALAEGGSALRLSPTSGEPASVTTPVSLATGRVFVFLRMRTAAPAGRDHVRIELDGEPQGELGGYRRDLPAEGWVWASVGPGEPPLALDIKTAGPHTFRLSATEPVDLDELWLSRSRHELPLENRVREP